VQNNVTLIKFTFTEFQSFWLSATSIYHLCLLFSKIPAAITRGNIYKIRQDQVRYDLHKFYFSNRVRTLWNFPRRKISNDHISGMGYPIHFHELQSMQLWRNIAENNERGVIRLVTI